MKIKINNKKGKYNRNDPKKFFTVTGDFDFLLSSEKGSNKNKISH